MILDLDNDNTILEHAETTKFSVIYKKIIQRNNSGLKLIFMGFLSRRCSCWRNIFKLVHPIGLDTTCVIVHSLTNAVVIGKSKPEFELLSTIHTLKLGGLSAFKFDMPLT